MAKRAFVLALMAVTLFWVSAQRMLDVSSGNFSTALTDATVDRSVVPTTNGYRVTYCFDNVRLMPDNLFSNCEIWQLDGFSTNNTPEEPAYPYSSDSFAIPSGYSAQVSIVNEEWTIVSSIPSPARQPLLLSDTIGYTVGNVLPINGSGKVWMPSQSVSDNGIHTYKGVDIINIGITPVQFDIANGKARICKTLEYEIIFQPNVSLMTASRTYNGGNGYFDDPYLSATTFNWEWEKSQQNLDDNVIQSVVSPRAVNLNSNTVDAPNYLIIAATPYKTAVETFAKWKRTLGFNVVTAYKEKWTSDEIYDLILDQDNISYLLFVGNNNQVPGDTFLYTPGGKDRLTLSDIGYACSNMNKIIPDFSYGRLPVNSLSEATRVLNRIISYEKTPVNSDTFYNSNLFISRFLGGVNNESMRNTQTTYDISEYMKYHNRSVCNMFKAAEKQYPMFWTDYGKDENGIFVNPAPVPFEMRKPQYAWDATSTDIISEINKGYSQVYYFAHGSIKSWSDPYINSATIANLSNGQKLPVVFSMACQTGDYSVPGSFAEKFLTASNGGAIGLFGFTNNTYIIYTDIIATSFFNMMYPNPGISPIINDKLDGYSIVLRPDTVKITELGLLQRMAITKMVNAIPQTSSSKEYKMYEAGMLTLFGDPSMHIALSNPDEIDPSIVYESAGRIRISNVGSSTITLYDGVTNKILNYKNSVTFTPPSDMSKFVVCVHAPGKVPYIMDLSDYQSTARIPAKAAEKKIVKEGQTWRYHSVVNTYMEPSSDIYLDLCFSGSSEIDGQEYLNCYVWKTDDDFSEATAALIGYMREDESGKVYVRYIADAYETALEKGIDILPYAPMMSVLNNDMEALSKIDILLYDPTLEPGDELHSSTDKYLSDNFTVSGMYDIECLGVTRNVWKLSGNANPNKTDYTFYEGVGDIYGLLPIPSPVPVEYGRDVWELKELLDQSGNVLFAPSLITSSVERTDVAEKVVKETFHNINGVEVSEPTGRGVYIKTETLGNGNVRTTKVLVQ